MHKTGVSAGILAIVVTAAFVTAVAQDQPPDFFNLGFVDGHSYVTSIKLQQGGTCWAHGTMAAVESSLMMNGNWAAAGDTGEPNLAEYHLDWWNGYNDFNNDDVDPPDGAQGVELHFGGDYRMAAAYISRGDGPVRDIDGQDFNDSPPRTDSSFHKFYVRDIEWYTAGADLSNINTIKSRLMSGGAIATCMEASGDFIDDATWIHYQPVTSSQLPTHAVTIVGWNDYLETGAPQGPGAWYVKNSWGTFWGLGGYFWISYYDRWAGQHPMMGAVSFRNPEPLSYDRIYYHDYHGWRREKVHTPVAVNAFHADGGDRLDAVSFYTMSDSVTYTVRIYDRFENGELLDELSSKTGLIPYMGFHTIDLDQPVLLRTADDLFYIYLDVSDSIQAYDCTAAVELLLGARGLPSVESHSEPGQSYFYHNGEWQDLFEVDNSANFCIKGLSRSLLKFEGSPTVGSAPLEVQFEAESPHTVDSWNWSFSDGSEVSGATVAHTFVNRGIYDATLTAVIEGDAYSLRRKDYVIALCDTVVLTAASAGPGNQAVVTISGCNVIPVRTVTIPLEFAGDADLSIDSVSIAGCRTADFASVATIHTDMANDRCTIRLIKSTSDSLDCLNPGDGPLLQVYFRVGSTIEGAVTSVSADGYSSYLPTFSGPLATYQAMSLDGSVTVVSCCGQKGNIDGQPGENGLVNVSDLTYLVAYLFQGGPTPPCLQEADLNGQTGDVNITDLTILTAYLFSGAQLPVSCR